MDKDTLVTMAFEAREASYSPYSNFCVGAAILCESGNVYTGCNIENASYGAAICAERAAAAKAVSSGERVFVAIAIVGAYGDIPEQDITDYAWPCGICRQFMNEFAAENMKMYIAKNKNDIYETTLANLLPHSFGPNDLL